MNALLDYGTSSDSDDVSNDSSSSKEYVHAAKCTIYLLATHRIVFIFCLIFREAKTSSKPKLPKPSLGENLQTSVFSNPFVAAERAKAAILEKHVKMVYVDFLFICNDPAFSPFL